MVTIVMAHLQRQRWTSMGALFLLLGVAHISINLVEANYATPTTSGVSSFNTDRNNGRAMTPPSPTSSKQFSSPPVTPAAKSLSTKRLQKQLEVLLASLYKIESRPTFTLAECQRWARLNDRYIETAGAQRKIRPSELAKKRECEALGLGLDQIINKLHNFKGALVDESNQLETASNLIADYAELKGALEANPEVAEEFEALRREDPQFSYAVERLDSQVKFLKGKTGTILDGDAVEAGLAVARSSQVPTAEEIDQVERATRTLIAKDTGLTDDEANQLLELGDALEYYLTDSSLVDPHTGRWRQMFGCLEAARNIVLRKLRGEELEPEEAQAAPPQQEEEEEEAATYAASFASAGDRANHWGTTAVAQSAGPGNNRLGAAAAAAATPGRGEAWASVPEYDPRDDEAAEAEAAAVAQAEARNNVARARAAAVAKRSMAVANARATSLPKVAPAPAAAPAPVAAPTPKRNVPSAIATAAAYAQQRPPAAQAPALRRRFADYASAASSPTRVNA